MMKKNRNLTGALMLLVASLIWGSAFVAQRLGSGLITPLTFVAARSLVGGIFLIPFTYILGKGERGAKQKTNKGKNSGQLILGGIVCGGFMALGSVLQQFGVTYTTAGKAGFITALYIIIVPVMSLFFKKRASWLVWVGIAVATVGMYLLCVKESLTIEKGDFFVLLCAFAFSAHILSIGYFAPRVNSVKLACVQLFAAFVVCSIPAMIFEKPSFTGILSCWAPILYAGVLSSGVAYTLQVVAQKRTEPAIASLIMCLESVFAALFGWILLKEGFSAKEMIGCMLVFTAVVLTQLPAEWFVLKRNTKEMNDVNADDVAE